jgi:tRNA threonylcarbamoyladenosine biosynthesis protein TsaE
MDTIKKTIKLTSTSLGQTFKLGKAIGAGIQKGLVITLAGDLASGKTSFVQGLAAGLDVPRKYYITSPSYTLINEYPGRIPLCHADLYRLGDHCDIEDTGLEEMLDGPCVLAIEWPDRLGRHRFENQLAITIQILEKEARNFEITAYGLHAMNLLKGIEK